MTTIRDFVFWQMGWRICLRRGARSATPRSASARAGADPVQSAVRYGAGIDKAWDIASLPEGRAGSRSRRKGEELGVGQTNPRLYPRPSSAYDIAITTILQVFETKRTEHSYTVINFSMDDRRGTEAIQFAEKNKVDLIFSMGSESTAAVQPLPRGAIPVVSVCSKDPVQLGPGQGLQQRQQDQFRIQPRSTCRRRADDLCAWLRPT